MVTAEASPGNLLVLGGAAVSLQLMGSRDSDVPDQDSTLICELLGLLGSVTFRAYPSPAHDLLHRHAAVTLLAWKRGYHLTELRECSR